jgi:Icc-related predicted phosphoesterase
MTRIAAVGDIHVGPDSVERTAAGLRHVHERAEVLLLAGDLTRCGDPREADLVVDVLRGVEVPVVAVLGNHDHHADRQDEVIRVLEDSGVRMLDRSSTIVDLDGVRVGIAGARGFGGGFAGASGSSFGEAAMKAFMAETEREASGLHDALVGLGTGIDQRIALLHYSPVPDTLRGERLEIYPFLGSYLLAEAVDTAGADLVIHGHAHAGTERGLTPGGIRVRNVAQPVIQHAYRVFELRTPAPATGAVTAPA